MVELIQHIGATLLFFAIFSPALDPIEHDFTAPKKHLEYQQITPVDQIVIATNGDRLGCKQARGVNDTASDTRP
ncbi:MAG: hypothetical protein KF682_09085 [Nitrospira sp.]|nr:hypothetical protein [Nitrospira sp.]